MQRTRAVLECTFTQADFDRFAALSGDDNPIHTDPAFSAKTRFGRTVAHGVLLLSVLRGLAAQLVPGGHMTEQSVMFPAPTYTNEPMRFSVELADKSPAGIMLRLEACRAKDGEVTCQGHCTVTP